MARGQFAPGIDGIPARDRRPEVRLHPLTETRRRLWAGRGLLAGLLAVQAALSLRLVNTAFQDEALYLYGGRTVRDHLLHGGAIDPYSFNTYFSGSPFLYPVLAASADDLGGLAGARALSLAFMLAASALLYALSRRLFGIRVALCAVGCLISTQSTQFLGHFATFDAMAICLLALAAWLVVRAGTAPWLLVPAVPVAVLAVSVKYAAALYLPTICGLALLTAVTTLRRALLRAGLFTVVTAGAMAFTLDRIGAFAALSYTTTERAHGQSPTTTLLAEVARWAGLWLLAALAGLVLVLAARRGRGPWPGGWRGGVLAVLLFVTALLSPAYQIHLHEYVSLSKHVGYGLFFAAPLMGLALARLAGPGFNRALPAIAVGIALLTAGTHQADRQFRDWTDSRLLLSVLWREVPVTGGHNLTELAEVPIYYMRARSGPESWTSMYYFRYEDLSGLAAYEAAVDDGFFDVIVLDRQGSRAVSVPLEARLRDRPGYRLTARIPFRTTTGIGDYEVWTRRR